MDKCRFCKNGKCELIKNGWGIADDTCKVEDNCIMYEPEPNSFGGRLKLKLEEKNITQREMAEMVGVSEVTISRYINGKREPKYRMAYKIAGALKCHPDELMPFFELDEE